MINRLIEIAIQIQQIPAPTFAEASRAEFTGPAEVLERLKGCEGDLRAVGRLVGDVVWTPGDAPLSVDVTLVQA